MMYRIVCVWLYESQSGQTLVMCLVSWCGVLLLDLDFGADMHHAVALSSGLRYFNINSLSIIDEGDAFRTPSPLAICSQKLPN